MNIQKNDIVKGLAGLGIKNGDSILVHSSLSSFGYVEKGAVAVIEALLESVDPEGTILVPTLTGRITDSVENPPVFDVRTSPCWTGKIPETFRLLPGAKRSLHPTHSVSSIGRKTDELISGHEKGGSPCDDRSPYYKNAALDGYILLIGCDQESNTTMHCCEEMAGVPYHLQNEIAKIEIKGYGGETITVNNRLHNWHKPPTDFNKMQSIYLEQGIMKICKIGNSTVSLLEAGKMLDLTVGMLKKDPLFLVCQPIP